MNEVLTVTITLPAPAGQVARLLRAIEIEPGS